MASAPLINMSKHCICSNTKLLFHTTGTDVFIFAKRTSTLLCHFYLKQTKGKFLTRPNVQRFVDDDPGWLVISRYNFYLYCMRITLLVASTRFSHYSKIICQRVASIVNVIDVITLKYKRTHIITFILVLVKFSGTG